MLLPWAEGKRERLVSASIACSSGITWIEKRLCNIRVIEIAFPSVVWIIREWKARTICAIDLVDTNEWTFGNDD